MACPTRVRRRAAPPPFPPSHHSLPPWCSHQSWSLVSLLFPAPPPTTTPRASCPRVSSPCARVPRRVLILTFLRVPQTPPTPLAPPPSAPRSTLAHASLSPSAPPRPQAPCPARGRTSISPFFSRSGSGRCVPFLNHPSPDCNHSAHVTDMFVFAYSPIPRPPTAIPSCVGSPSPFGSVDM